ncbi:hypothetical protein BMH32_00990 [Leucobacter sp. OLJS4]|uniref:DUF3040 domain-containing protein n=1 Tax=unclassified Leucobacter TaxID=2621730 RepID=UPI000C174A58|nr:MULTISPECIES: DUF3040 domain-containing protein [unclassified Leucobacter]PIJ49088.1 hypothetical protein BMH30_04730 [Leucobacter sp. OLES1]PII81289.1 hypothetical protein BMH25_12010 [Leucobacter sp. OLCALW19]PII85955.1 hypothetical protein BMH26_12425 [Leucobacter sp. OLTLW20]PII89851.1 hypothetical protein BMH27_10590 [Leucobacter sp. OLAS13]PII96881.1 hypothetical protein BMH29_11275 [Leucobacter sp. OLDS2]
MALSEHEQRLLDEMERRLYQSEADVMSASTGERRRVDLRSLVLGIVVVLVGVGVLIGAVAASQLWLGLVGFVVMLGGAVLALTRRTPAEPGEVHEPVAAGGRAHSGGRRSNMNERLERRWDERMEGER